MPLKVSHGIKSWIDDFQQSKDKRFDGKSAEKRREMAIAAYMAAKREQKENVKTADKKPEVFTKPDGKKGVRMVPVDREVVKQEKNLEWLKAALEAQARKTKPCDEDVEETSEAKVDELSMSLKDLKKTGLNKAASANKEKLKKDIEAMKAKLNKEAKVDEVSLDKAKSAYYKRKSQAQGAAAQGSMDYAKKQMAKARKTKAYIDKRESVEEATMSTKAGRKQAAADAVAHHKAMVKKWGISHPATKDAEKAANHHMKKANEVLDRPGALDSYRKKADASGNKARNTATAKIVRGNPDVSKEKDTMRKRNKGQDMADRAANRHFRKSIGLGYNSKKESVELDENKYAAKSAERHKNLMKQARSDMKKATSHSDMIKHMNKYQAANKAYDRATRGQFDEDVNEISIDKLSRYGKAAAKDVQRQRDKVKGALDQPLSTKHQKAGMAAMKKLTKRSKGSDMYVDKMTGRSKVKPSAATVGKDKHVSVDEISNAKMGQYVRKAADDAARKASKGDVVGARQRVKGVNKAMDKMDKNRLYGRQ